MIYLGIGSNLNSRFGNRFDNINKSLQLLKNKKLKIVKISKFYETPSYPNKNLPKFINIAVSINFSEKPSDLLKITSDIEKKMDRVLTPNNEPRTLDIDIIDFKNIILKTKLLELPHPKAQERNFVLMPLFEISKKWVHPKSKDHIKTLILKLSKKDITSIKQI